VTAAGIVENFEAENYEYSRWLKTFDVNVNGSFLFSKAAGKYWIESGIKGNLILVSSMSSIICVRPQKQAAYNAVRRIVKSLMYVDKLLLIFILQKQSKGAVSLLGRSLATEVGSELRS
jgi:sorbose reductase